MLSNGVLWDVCVKAFINGRGMWKLIPCGQAESQKEIAGLVKNAWSSMEGHLQREFPGCRVIAYGRDRHGLPAGGDVYDCKGERIGSVQHAKVRAEAEAEAVAV